MSLKAKIEAVLYLTDKPLRAQAIAGIVGEELQLVRAALLDLIHEYEERQGGLEIADEDGYSFQVKDQYSNLMDEFLPIEMSAAQLRTLSAIAIKQPIAQSEIIRIRGAGAYDHIKELVLRGLITKKEDEKLRSPMLSTTKQFQEYFRLTKDGKSLRSYLKREMKKKDKAEELASAIPGEAAESTTPPNDLIFAPGDLSPTESEPIIVGEDAPTEATPVVAEAGSAVTETDPVVAESGSVVTKTDPVVAESGSAVTETDPVVAESGSAITKTDSVVAATESESTATASGSAGGSPAHSANLESLLAKTDSVMNETPATPDSLIPVLLIDNAPERESEAPSTVSMEELTDSQVDSLS